MANNTNYGLAGSVWTENLSLALEVALSIKAGSVWVNGHNLFDAAAGFGGYRESGFGRDGGKEVRISCMKSQSFRLHKSILAFKHYSSGWLKANMASMNQSNFYGLLETLSLLSNSRSSG